MSARRHESLWLVVLFAVLLLGPDATPVRAADGLNAIGSNGPFSQSSFLEPAEKQAGQTPASEALPKPELPDEAKFVVPVQPAEPERPRWGSLDRPIDNLPPFPVFNYLLAGPQSYVFQRFSGHGYERPVVDPSSTEFDDRRFSRPIDLNRPDGLAPMGVIGDHTINGGGQFLVSYRYSASAFQGNQSGTQPVSDAAVAAQGYAFVPKNMLLERHLFLLEWAPVDRLTVIAQLPVLQGTIRYQTAAGGVYQDDRTDIGDTTITALYALRRWNRQQLHLNFGMTYPTNLIQNLGNLLPDVNGLPRLSYPIRTGSGSFDLLPGLTYRGQTDFWTWGAQATVTARTGFNQYNYILGNQFELTPWLAGKLTDRWSLSSRLDWRYWGNIHGADPGLTPIVSPTMNPNLQGGTRVDLLFGANYLLPQSTRPNWDRSFSNRLGVEAGFPVYQFLDGPQLQNQWSISTGWNLTF